MPGGIVNKDQKITKFITDVMTYCRNNVQWDINTNPLSARPDKSGNYDQLDTKVEPTPTDFHVVSSLGGNVNASVLATVFQIFAYNITRYRPVRMYVRATAGQAITDFGTNPTALNSKHTMAIATFNTQVQATPQLANLEPGNVAAEAALDNLIARLRNIVSANMASATPYRTITACHNSCHSNCHSSRSRR